MEISNGTKIIPLIERIEHYDHADLQNPYNYGNLFVPAARDLGFNFRIAPILQDDHPKIEATPETIKKLDAIGDQLSLRGITGIYTAVDDGDLDLVKDIDELRGAPVAVFNEIFLKKCYLLAYERRAGKASQEGTDPEKPTMPTGMDTERYHQIKFSLRDKTPFNHETMIRELTNAISEVLVEHPELRPSAK